MRQRFSLLCRLFSACLAGVLLSLLIPASAYAGTIRQVDDVLGSVGGNVYISGTPNGDNGQYWANGAWHNLTLLDPADKNTQDGQSVPIGNGWFIWWSHNTWGGSYAIWRYPDAGGVTYSGSTWPGFKIRLNNVGYTSTGENIDSIIDFSSVYAWQANNLVEPAWFSPFQVSKLYGPLVAAVSSDDQTAPVGVDTTFTTTLVKAGTETPIDSSNQMDVVYWDIDQPVHRTPDGAPTSDFDSEWREGLHLVSGYQDEVIIGTNTDLHVSDNNTWFRSGADDPSGTPTNRSTIVAKAGPQFTTQWRGEGCATGIGYDSKVVLYPQWPDPVKAPPVQIKKRGEIASFDITETFPYVTDSNKAQSIVMTDTLDPALDASQATVQVLKDGVDVTNNWAITVSGQTITATALNTGHGYAESEHVFRITAPVSQTADLSGYERGDTNGLRYWKFPNQASIAINGNPKPTNTVHVLVPYEAQGKVQLGTTKKLLGRALADGQFTFDLKNENGVVLETKTNDATGAVTFSELTYTQDDIGKTFTYTIVERNDAAQGYLYDTHVETVTVEVTDAGQGKLNVLASYDADGAVFVNEYKTPLAVIKQSSEGTGPLSGAEFTLYTDDGNGVFDAGDQPAVVYSDVGLQNIIPNAAITTGADGKALYYGLTADTSYWLRETRAPTGFNLDDTAHLISVSATGQVTTKALDGTTVALPIRDQIATITISDDPIPTLPNAAGPGIAGLVFGGAFLIVGGSGIALSRRAGRGSPRQ